MQCESKHQFQRHGAPAASTVRSSRLSLPSCRSASACSKVQRRRPLSSMLCVFLVSICRACVFPLGLTTFQRLGRKSASFGRKLLPTKATPRIQQTTSYADLIKVMYEEPTVDGGSLAPPETLSFCDYWGGRVYIRWCKDFLRPPRPETQKGLQYPDARSLGFKRMMFGDCQMPP